MEKEIKENPGVDRDFLYSFNGSCIAKLVINKLLTRTKSQTSLSEGLNNIAARMDTLLNRTFCGVSTKYLQLYVNWFKLKENNKRNAKNINLQKEILSKKYTWDLYSNIEKVYKNFIKNHSARTYRCPQAEKFKAQSWNQDVVLKYSFL